MTTTAPTATTDTGAQAAEAQAAEAQAPEGYGAWVGGTDHKSVGTFCLFIAFLFLLTGGALTLLTTVLRMRAPGLTLARLPMFSWSVFVASATFLLAAPVLVAGLIVLYVDHHMGAHVLDNRRGGDPLVWRTLFTFFAYP